MKLPFAIPVGCHSSRRSCQITFGRSCKWTQVTSEIGDWITKTKTAAEEKQNRWTRRKLHSYWRTSRCRLTWRTQICWRFDGSYQGEEGNIEQNGHTSKRKSRTSANSTARCGQTSKAYRDRDWKNGNSFKAKNERWDCTVRQIIKHNLSGRKKSAMEKTKWPMTLKAFVNSFSQKTNH